MIVAETGLVTREVLIVNVALDAPAAIVTLAGVVAEEELDVSATIAPPGPAAPVNFTEPVA